MALVIAHVSDLHVFRHGEHVTSLRTSLRSQKGKQDETWETVADLDGWLIQKRTKWRWRIRDTEDALEMRLLDDEGYVQQRKKGRRGDEAKVRAELEEMTSERQLTEHARLARSLPTREKVEALLAEDPTNTNLKFLRA